MLEEKNQLRFLSWGAGWAKPRWPCHAASRAWEFWSGRGENGI